MQMAQRLRKLEAEAEFMLAQASTAAAAVTCLASMLDGGCTNWPPSKPGGRTTSDTSACSNVTPSPIEVSQRLSRTAPYEHDAAKSYVHP